MFGRNYGHDLILGVRLIGGGVGGVDFLAGVSQDDLVLSRDGVALLVGIEGDTGQLTIAQYFADAVSYTVDSDIIRFYFSDDTQWEQTEITNRAMAASGGVPTSGNDGITGTAAAETIDALDGDDVVYARGGNDIVSGGGGNDTLYGEAGNDVLSGATATMCFGAAPATTS